MLEKRRSIRIDTIMNAICSMGRGIKRTYDVRNISKEGALLILDTPLSKGSELNLSMDVPGDNIPIFVSCSVAWQKESMVRLGSPSIPSPSALRQAQCRPEQSRGTAGSERMPSLSRQSKVEGSIMEPKRRIYETGVKFIEIDNSDKSRFFEYIYSQWLKLLERKQ